MITIEELCADNRKLVDENLKLRKEKTNLEEIIACLRENEAKQVKDKEWLSSVIEKRNKRIDELQKETTALKNEIVNLKGVIESLSEQRDRLEAGRPKWHKVADGDLPKGNCENILLYNKDHFCVTHSYSLGYYENGVFYNDCEMEEDTIAWCEIPQYTGE